MGIFLINPFLLKPIITRTFFDAGYTVTRSTTTSTVMASRMSLSTTEPASTNYAAFWQITHDNSSATADSRAQLFETSARQLQNMEPQDTTDRFASGGMYAYAGGTNKTFQIQTSTESGTHGYAGYALNALQLTAADNFVYLLSGGSTTSTTFVTNTSTTFPEPGDYVVIGSAELVPASTNYDARLLYNNTTAYGTLAQGYQQDVTNYSPYFHVQRITGVTAGQTIALQRRSITAASTIIRNSSILLLKISGFENFYYAEQPTTQATTSTTYTAELSQSFNIVNPSNKHLVLASAMMRVNSTANSGYCKLVSIATAGGTTTRDYNVEHLREANGTGEWYPTIIARINDMTDAIGATDFRFEWQSRAEVAGTTIELKNMSIAIFDLGTP